VRVDEWAVLKLDISFYTIYSLFFINRLLDFDKRRVKNGS
jgi:hypothetical protein